MEKSVSVWQETVFLPTYNIGSPEKNPIFLEKRVYQGSSGAVYPYAVVEKIEDQKTEKAYTALFLENAYLKIMILPELGGRIHRAYDKIRNRDFVYYNQVCASRTHIFLCPGIDHRIPFDIDRFRENV